MLIISIIFRLQWLSQKQTKLSVHCDYLQGVRYKKLKSLAETEIFRRRSIWLMGCLKDHAIVKNWILKYKI